MTIKMKDVFSGKVSVDEHKNVGDLLANFCGCETFKEAEAVAVAINAYDANQQEIIELKAKLSLADAIINKRVDNEKKQAEELKAMVNALRDALYPFLPHEFQYNDGSECMGDDVNEALNESKEQCLTDVKADAVKDFMNYIQYAEEDELINEEGISESFDFWLESQIKLKEK